MVSYVLPVDKPVGPTSHDMVAMARRALGTRRIGHTGTLDPFASGLLLLCINQATRIVEYLTDLPKQYHAVARFDGTTATDDATGEFLQFESAFTPQTDDDAVRAAFASQLGTILQRPSTFSAKKVGGERAYAIARRGEMPDLPPAEVTIYDITIRAIDWPEVTFAVTCSSGTYVRAIARDVGATLGTGGYLRELRRTAIGAFGVAGALSPDQLVDGDRVDKAAVPVLDALGAMPKLEIDEAQERAVRYGQAFEGEAPAGVIALARDGVLVALAQTDGRRIKPKKVFPDGS